jgi:hypothetical protein
MPKAVVALNEQQVDRLEQAVIDHDEKTAWALLREIRAKVKAAQNTACGIDKLRRETDQRPLK